MRKSLRRKKNIHCDFGICVRKGYVLLLMWMSIHGRLDFTIMRKIYCIVRLVVWKNQLMNSMKNFWNLVVSVYSRRNKEQKGGSPVKREKSCGALVYRITQSGQKELLFIKHRHGTHWSFPKGHVEGNETVPPP